MAVAVLDRIRQAHPDAVKRVDDVDEAAKPDLHIAVEAKPGVLLDRLYQQLRAAVRVRGVDLVLAMPRNVDVGVTGMEINADLPPGGT